MAATLWIPVPVDAAGRRIDRFVTEYLAELDDPAAGKLSRSRIQRLIDNADLQLDGCATRSSERLRGGESIRLTIPEPKPMTVEPEPMSLDVLFEDDDLIAVNKAAGVVVHPGAGHSSGTLVHGLLHHCGDLSGIGGVLRPGIVHRLDRGTSGVMVVAKNDRAHQELARQFAAHSVEKTYEAYVIGVPKRQQDRIETRFGRHPKHRQRFSSKVTSGRVAVTEYRVVCSVAGLTQLEVRLHTGRTHQIRVHLSDLGHPVAGDPLYGGTRLARLQAGPVREAAARLTRQALHAKSLSFQHPISNRQVRLQAPLPADIAELRAAMQAP